MFADTIRDGDLETFRKLAKTWHEYLFMTTPFGSWLHFAASQGHLPIVKHALDVGFDVNLRAGVSDGTALNEAALEGHVEIVEFLHTKGGEFDLDDPTRNPLFGAIVGGHLNVAKYLLDNGIDKTVRYTGETMNEMDAYEFAMERGETKIAQLLRENVG